MPAVAPSAVNTSGSGLPATPAAPGVASSDYVLRGWVGRGNADPIRVIPPGTATTVVETATAGTSPNYALTLALDKTAGSAATAAATLTAANGSTAVTPTGGVAFAVALPALLPLPYTAAWPGAAGAAWPSPPWTMLVGTTGGGALTQSGDGRGRVVTTTTTGSCGGAYLSRVTPTVDQDVTVDVEYSAVVDAPSYLSVRGSAAQYSTNPELPNTGYTLAISPTGTSATVYRIVNGTLNAIGGGIAGFGAWTAGVRRRIRFQAVGSVLRVKVWAPGAAEPASWLWTYTDPSPGILATTPGVARLGAFRSAGTPVIYFGPLVVTDGTPAAVTMPAWPPSGATLYSQTWTGADQSALPSDWTYVYTGTSSAVRYFNEWQQVPSQGRAAGYVAVPASADVDLVVDNTYRTSTETGSDVNYLAVRGGAPSASNQGLPSEGYVLAIPRSGSASLSRVVGDVFATVASGAYGKPAAGTTLRIRLQAAGGVIRAKLWTATDAEPAAWAIEYTDPSPLVTGRNVWLSSYNSVFSSVTRAWDNLTVKVP